MSAKTSVVTRRPPVPVARQGVVVPLAGAAAASLIVGLGMLILRSALSVRSVPERLMEWLLLFIPPGVFEAMLRQFSFDAKRYGLNAAIVVMLLVLTGVGYVALRRGLSMPMLALLGLGFWLFVMVVVMPLTSAGLFASDLLDGMPEAVLGYLAVGLSYAMVLAVTRAVMASRANDQQIASSAYVRMLAGRKLPMSRTSSLERRTLLALGGGTVVAYVAGFATQLLPRSPSVPNVLIADPQEPVPSGGLEPPNPHPQNVTNEGAAGAEAAAAPPAAAPAVSAPANPGLPEPTVIRELSRDKDGAVLPSGRPMGELAPSITSNNDFYIVTKNAGGDPILHPGDWRLLVDGMVERSFQLDYPTLRRLPAVEVTKTLECISNFVGKPELAPFGAELISTARWKGVRVRDILQLTGGPKPEAAWVAVLSADEYTSALPLEAVLDPDTLLVYEMNGEVLPREHGYPARLLVPGRYGMKNAKWVIGLRPTTREFYDWYGQRNWSKEGIVRTMTRIDSPMRGATLPTGPGTISGVSYAGTRGIQKVEYSADGGMTWQDAELLEPPLGGDSWIRWRGPFSVQAGAKTSLVARATDGKGELQTEAFTLPEPDGGTGWPRIEVGQS